jgi:hypothetical protein
MIDLLLTGTLWTSALLDRFHVTAIQTGLFRAVTELTHNHATAARIASSAKPT